MADKDKAKAEEHSQKLYDDAQESLVACLLASSKDASDVFEILVPEDFIEPKHELIYSAAVDLARQSEPIDVYTIASHLESLGELNTVDGLTGLQSLATQGKLKARSTPIKVYARILKELSAKRRIFETLSEAQEQFRGDSGVTAADSVTDLQSKLNEQIYKMANESTVSEISDVPESYAELLEERRRISEENEEVASGLQGIPSLLPSLNKYTTGWKPSQMITVAAATGVGKSVFAINAACAAMQANKSVMFFALEMETEEINDRIISSISSIPMNDLKQGVLDEEQEQTLRETMEELKLSKLTVDAAGKQTIDSIRAKALKKAHFAEGLDFIVIDYLQLITAAGRYSSRQEQVADISRNMKLLAKQLRVPIMVLAQMNRQSTDDEEGMPTLNGIRESGAIAQDSDVVILLHRKKPTDEDIPPTYVILAKQRNGEADKVIKCHSHLECSVFREMTVRKDFDSYSEEELEAHQQDLDARIGDDDDDDLGMDDWDDFE